MANKLSQSIMVTGSSGFIGQNLIRTLKSVGYPVTAVIRQAKSFIDENVYEVGDINAFTNWFPSLRNVRCIIHAAGKAHAPKKNDRNFLGECMRINCDSTINLAQQAAKAGTSRFIFISSIHVNGHSCLPDEPIRYDSPINLVDPYGQSKYEAEVALKEISERTGMELVIIRPPLVYGPGVKANFSRLIKLAGCGIPLPLEGINNQRSYVGIDNLTDLIICCIDSPKAAGGIFLVSDGCDISTPNLIRLIANAKGETCRMFKVSGEKLFICAKLLGITEQIEKLSGSLFLDIRPTCERLNWFPPNTLEEELRNIFSNFRKGEI